MPVSQPPITVQVHQESRQAVSFSFHPNLAMNLLHQQETTPGHCGQQRSSPLKICSPTTAVRIPIPFFLIPFISIMPTAGAHEDD